jgi:4a-hydroxytetrahydrobiopterin dehydratase
MARTPLSDIEIQRELGSLPGWSRRGNALTRTWVFASFPAGIEWVRRVAEAAEAANHHRTSTSATRGSPLSTHDAGGITAATSPPRDRRL